MPAELSAEQVWEVIEKHNFGVLGMATAKGEARTAGIVYIVDGRRLYIGTWTEMWKTRHVAQNPNVSLTIPIHKRVPFMPWIKVPAATITFSGKADVIAALDAPRELLEKLYHGVASDEQKMARYSLIEVTPVGEFLTYGIGMSLLDMRDPQKAPPALPPAQPAAGPRSHDIVISAEGLERRFGDFQAVRGISFSVRRGEIFGLLGANGAGKTTTFRMLCGLLPASAGELRVAGHDLRRAGASARRSIGYVDRVDAAVADPDRREPVDQHGRAALGERADGGVGALRAPVCVGRGPRGVADPRVSLRADRLHQVGRVGVGELRLLRADLDPPQHRVERARQPPDLGGVRVVGNPL